MPRYIDAEKAKEVIKMLGKAAIEDGRRTLDPVGDIVSLAKGIDMIPAADVQEVIRCKDCKFWDGDGYCEGIQNGLIREYTKPDDFCSYGERKKSE